LRTGSFKPQRSLVAEEYEFAVAGWGKFTTGSSHDELVIRTLPSGCATATSESLSVLAWIWLMPLSFPRKGRSLKLLVTFRRRTVHHGALVLTDGSSLLDGSFTNEDGERSPSLRHHALAVDGLRGDDLRVTNRAHATVDATQLKDGVGNSPAGRPRIGS
jgi:hypothetical protein